MEQSVTIAGLCHNLGHGPFSFSFTHFVRDNLHIDNWDHSEQSTLILEDLIDNNNIDIAKEQRNFIYDLITGKKNKTLNGFLNTNSGHWNMPNWLFQIVNNQTNSVDLDKFDFINRDTYKLGVNNQSIDYEILSA